MMMSLEPRPAPLEPALSSRSALLAFQSSPAAARAARHRTTTPAACPPWPAPCPNRDRPSAHRLPGQPVALDLLVEIRSRHVESARGLRNIPIELAQLGEQERPLRGVFELLERLAVEQRSNARLLRTSVTHEPPDVVS